MSLEEAAVLLAAEDGMDPALYRAEAEKIRAAVLPGSPTSAAAKSIPTL
jgi:hypothetical protein